MKTITAIITPILDNKKVDFHSLENLINQQIEAKIDGILFAGSTGEKFGLSQEAFFELCQFAVKICKNKTEILINAGTFNTEESTLNAKKCQDIGADSLLAVNPYYNKPTQKGLHLHFKSIANSVQIPVYLYNIPGRTSVNLNTDTLEKLLEVKNIKGIKDSTGSISQLVSTFNLKNKTKRNDFEIFCGDDNLMHSFLTLGANGIISVITNLFPKEIKHLVSSFENKNFSQERYSFARDIFFAIFSLTEALCRIGNNPIATKTILAKKQIIKENFFEPLCSVEDPEKEELFKIFNQAEKELLKMFAK